MGVDRAAVEATVGALLHHRRVALGMSTARLAEDIGVRPSEISRWERGDTTPPPTRIRAMARVLGLDQATMLSWIAGAGDFEPSAADVDHVDITIDLAPPDPFVVITDRSRTVAVSVTRNAPKPQPVAVRPVLRPPPVASVFPAPTMSLEADRHVYSSVAGFPRAAHPHLTSTGRMIRVVAALIALGLTFRWALGELGHGFGDLLDLFGGP